MSASPASAADAAPVTTPSAENKAAAQEHFTHAKELYQTGRYQEAVAELEAARKLDPTAKDLVFNLGVVSEKLGRIDDALGYFHSYVDMAGVTPAEQKRAETIIKRLEGARSTAPTPSASASGSASAGTTGEPPPPPPPQVPEKRPHGRIDAATIAAASIGVVGIGVGSVFGVKAMGDAPSANTTTSKTNPFSNLQSKQDSAHKEGVIADVGFAVGGAGIIAAAILYFGREKDKPPPPPRTEGLNVKLTNASAAPSPDRGGATFALGGTF